MEGKECVWGGVGSFADAFSFFDRFTAPHPRTEAVHIETGKLFACKVINKKMMQGREQMVRNEIMVLRTISKGHSNILTLEDYFEVRWFDMPRCVCFGMRRLVQVWLSGAFVGGFFFFFFLGRWFGCGLM